jgi:aminomethyltransferase
MTDGYRALRDSVAWLALDTRGRFLARGRDCVRFLHNVTSNDVKKLTPGAGCYAFLLTAQGRIQADLHLFRFEDHFLIDTEADLRQKAPRLILKYKVADQIELEDVTDKIASIAVEGPGSEAAIAAVMAAAATAAAAMPAAGAPVSDVDGAHVAWGDATVARVSLTGQPGYRLYGPADRKAQWVAQLQAAGVVPATDEDARVVRIENGKPRYGDDIRETSLPQETQQMHAVSFAKGCYLGQEIVERIRAQGRVNRKLVRVEVQASEPLAPGTKLMAQRSEAGEVTSSVFSPRAGKVVALAYVRSQFAEPGTVLEAGQTSAVVG